MRHKARGNGNPNAYLHAVTVVGKCEPCDKVIYLSRKAARTVGKTLTDGPRPRAYRCPENRQHWHLGGLPQPVRAGQVTRDRWFK